MTRMASGLGRGSIERSTAIPRELGLAARQGIVMAEFSGMVQKSQKLRKRKPTTRVPQSSSKMSKTIDPDCVKVVNADDGWEEIEFALESGDTETVMGEDMLSSEIKEGAASKRRVEYEIATWALIPNLGGEEVSGRQSRGRDPEHHCPGMGSKQGPHKREEGDAGSRVVFDEEETYIEDRATGEQIWATDYARMFMVKMWVNRKARFQRQENELEKARDP